MGFAPDDTIVAIATPPGRGGIGVVRIAGPTLVWERDGITFRLEGVDKARAVELATGTS